MIKSPKSMAEILISEEIGRMEDIKQNSEVTIRDVNRLIHQAFKILEKCEELRKSRDNWRNRFEEANKEVRRLKNGKKVK